MRKHTALTPNPSLKLTRYGRQLSSNYKGFPIVVKQKSLVVESRSD